MFAVLPGSTLNTLTSTKRLPWRDTAEQSSPLCSRPPSVIMDVMLSQPCSKILVGDPHQQIYTFRGAVNALNLVEHTHIYYLTQVGAGGERDAQQALFAVCPSYNINNITAMSMLKEGGEVKGDDQGRRVEHNVVFKPYH